MSRIAEIYGKGTHGSHDLLSLAQNESCLISGKKCDGGGNRYASNIQIKNSTLDGKITDKVEICSSICSLEVGKNKENWIVCPRRLVTFGENRPDDPQILIKKFIFEKANLTPPFAVWREVKMKVKNEDLLIDYTFDYVASKIDENGKPIGGPVIIEVMTSSTSGGNKTKRTTIPQSFEDLLTIQKHTGPGINYRQVWGRMISQFFVKSQLAREWGGMTFWIIQDSLTRYIEKSTAFNFENHKKDEAREINLISVSYGHDSSDNINIFPSKIEMAAGDLGVGDKDTFFSILTSAFIPKRSEMARLLMSKPPVSTYL
jgi:hypothetical protein